MIGFQEKWHKSISKFEADNESSSTYLIQYKKTTSPKKTLPINFIK